MRSLTLPQRFALLTVGAALLAPVLSGCSGAYVDRRREAGTAPLVYVGESTPSQPSVCYNSLTTTPEEVRALADKVCQKIEKTAVLVKHEKRDCTLLYPSRATFTCREVNAVAPAAN